MSIQLDHAAVQSMVVGRVHKYPSRIVSVDFSNDGDSVAVATASSDVYFYSAIDSDETRHLLCRQFGVGKLRFTHHTNAVIHSSSSKYDDAIRYWSITDNSYLRTFKGHTDRIVSLEVSPVNDTFLSSSLDYSVRLWDLRDSKCQAILRWKPSSPHLPIVAYDPQGLVFAVSTNLGQVKLFDARDTNRGPFAVISLPDGNQADISAVKFSPSGSHMIVSSLQGNIYVANALTGAVERTLTGFKNEHKSILEPAFSTNSKFIFCGSENGTVHAWNTFDGSEAAVWDSVHPGPVHTVAWNPVNAMFVTACSNLAMWSVDSQRKPSNP